MTCANDDTLIDRIIMINPQSLVSLAKVPSKQSKLLKNILYMPVIGTFIYKHKNKKIHYIREIYFRIFLQSKQSK